MIETGLIKRASVQSFSLFVPSVRSLYSFSLFVLTVRSVHVFSVCVFLIRPPHSMSPFLLSLHSLSSLFMYPYHSTVAFILSIHPNYLLSNHPFHSTTLFNLSFYPLRFVDPLFLLSVCPLYVSSLCIPCSYCACSALNASSQSILYMHPLDSFISPILLFDPLLV